MSTKNNPGRFDCYEKAGSDEPMFVLLARDKHAPTLVWLWSVLREIDGEDAATVGEARECCTAMLAWMTDHDRKAAGLGQAVLAGAMELCRAANFGRTYANSEGTDVDVLRRYLCETRCPAPEESP